jgi:hypothetical protein
MVQSGSEGDEVREVMRGVGSGIWDWLSRRPISTVGIRG